MSFSGMMVPVDAMLETRILQVRQLLESAEDARDNGGPLQAAVLINLIAILDILLDEEKMDILESMSAEIDAQQELGDE